MIPLEVLRSGWWVGVKVIKVLYIFGKVVVRAVRVHYVANVSLEGRGQSVTS